MYAFCLGIAFDDKGQVCAPHWLSIRDVGSHQLDTAKGNARVLYRVFPFWADVHWMRHLAVGHHHADFSAEMRLIETKGFGAFTSEVHVRFHFHYGFFLS